MGVKTIKPRYFPYNQLRDLPHHRKLTFHEMKFALFSFGVNLHDLNKVERYFRNIYCFTPKLSGRGTSKFKQQFS